MAADHRRVRLRRIGELTGNLLKPLPASIVSWQEFRQRFPQGKVLSRDTGHRRDYGSNPYVGYDRIDQSPFLFRGPTDGRLPPMERVATVSLGGEDVAYPFSVLQQRRVVHDQVGGQPVVVFYQSGTASALDGAVIASSRDVGATGVYRSTLEGRRLTFAWKDDTFVDAETGQSASGGSVTPPPAPSRASSSSRSCTAITSGSQRPPSTRGCESISPDASRSLFAVISHRGS